MLSPIKLRAHSSKLPDSINLPIPVFNSAIAVAPTCDAGKIRVRIALVCCANLINSNNLRLRHPLVFGSTKKVLSVNKGVSQEIGRAHHRNEFLGLHVWEALVTDDAVVYHQV